MSNYWVFGSSKPLGAGIANHLRARGDVFCFSRNLVPDIPNQICIDLSNIVESRRIIAKQFTAAAPAGVLFCQRYRPDPTIPEVDAIKNGVDVELAPILDVIEQARGAGRRLSVVLLSSVAGQNGCLDIPISYQILKAITLMATKSLSTLNAQAGIRINCIALGELQKYSPESYNKKEQKKFSSIKRFTFDHRMCRVDDVARVVTFLLSEESEYVTGQIINLDGNLSNLSQESMIRVIGSGWLGGNQV